MQSPETDNYYTIFNKNLFYDKQQYKFGENIFNPKTWSDSQYYCKPITKDDKGLFFTTYENLYLYTDRGTKMAKIKLYSDSEVLNDSYNKTIYTTNKFEIIEIMNIPREIYLESVKSDGSDIRFVPEFFLDHEMCLEAVKRDGMYLAYIKEDKIDKEIALEAIKTYAQAMWHVPDSLMTKEFCLEATNLNIGASTFIPDKIIDDDICLEVNKILSRKAKGGRYFISSNLAIRN
jgi:hypothetical protein